MSWKLTSNRSLERCTLGSTMACTFNSRAISESFLCSPLKYIEEVTEGTVKDLTWAKCVVRTSVKPSARNSCPGSPVRFLHGRTATDAMGPRRSEERRVGKEG